MALVGDLLATQAKGRGVGAILVDAAVRDVEELREVGLPIWARFVRVPVRRRRLPARSASRFRSVARRFARVTWSCLTRTAPWSSSAERVAEVLEAARARAEREREKRAKLEAGELSYDLDGLRQLVER